MNRYATGKDEYGNSIFDFKKVSEDIKSFIKGKKKMSKDLYNVMSLRFTIAHYDMYTWCHFYNGFWAVLGQEIENHIRFYESYRDVLEDLALFLRENNKVEVVL